MSRASLHYLDYASHRELVRQYKQRRMAGFEGLLIKARQGDPWPLVAYFLQGRQRQLSGLDCVLLALFLKEKLWPRKNGRPRQSVTRKTVAIACAAHLVRIGKSTWCQKHGRERASNAAIATLIKRAIELVEAKIPEARGQISIHFVRDKANLSPEEDDAIDDNVIDDLYEEIIALALKLSP